MNAVGEKKNGLFQVFLWIVFGIAILAIVLPMMNIISISLSGKGPISRGEVGLFPKEFTLDAYARVFSNHNIVYSMGYSIVLTLAKAALSIGVTILAAYPLSKNYLFGRKFLMLIITVTMYVSAGTIPTYLLMRDLHLLNTVWVLLIPGMLSTFNLIILRSFFSSLNPSLFDAAYIDGCGEWRAMVRIAVPLSLPSIFTLTLFYAVSRWNGVTDVIYYISDPKLYTLQYQLKLMLDTLSLPPEFGEVVRDITPENVKSATVVFAMVPMIIIYPFVQKYFTKGVMIGGVKE